MRTAPWTASKTGTSSWTMGEKFSTALRSRRVGVRRFRDAFARQKIWVTRDDWNRNGLYEITYWGRLTNGEDDCRLYLAGYYPDQSYLWEWEGSLVLTMTTSRLITTQAKGRDEP